MSGQDVSLVLSNSNCKIKEMINLSCYSRKLRGNNHAQQSYLFPFIKFIKLSLNMEGRK